MNRKKIVVDEGISQKICNTFLLFLEEKGIKNLETLFIGTEHKGMPDSRILGCLLNKETIFLTGDRPFHNKVLSEGLTSYYAHQGTFTSRKLKGIIPKDNFTLNKNDTHIKKEYLPQQPDIRSCVMPASEGRLKKLRTKRRRIRNHFNGIDHIQLTAITVSWKTASEKTLIGVQFKTSSNTGIKAITASENYFSESIPPEHRTLAAFNHALIVSIQLMLNSVKTHLYFDAPKMENPLPLQKCPDTMYDRLFTRLVSHFPDIEFIPSTKGPFIEKMRTKLKSLAQNNSNEIIPANLAEIVNRIDAFDAKEEDV